MVAQYLISPEVLAKVVIFTFAALACVAIQPTGDLAELGRTLLAPFGLALAVAAVLLAYPVWMLLGRTSALRWAHNSVSRTRYHNDLLNFVVPGPLDRVSLGMRSLGAHLQCGKRPRPRPAVISVSHS